MSRNGGAREAAPVDLSPNAEDIGRELFGGFRQHVSTAETGAVSLFEDH